MSQDELDRRHFHRLTAAAFGGLMAGTSWGCRSQDASQPSGGESSSATGEGGDAVAVSDKNLCRGLNDCQAKGAGGDNACRGQGQCATFEHHTCAAQNACKGQGGCGENPGLNACKGQGSCSVPLMEPAWEKVRARKEQEWQAADQDFGAAPAKAE
jgi:hypothetical protein